MLLIDRRMNERIAKNLPGNRRGLVQKRLWITTFSVFLP